jgi:hypothetical protein
MAAKAYPGRLASAKMLWLQWLVAMVQGAKPKVLTKNGKRTRVSNCCSTCAQNILKQEKQENIACVAKPTNVGMATLKDVESGNGWAQACNVLPKSPSKQ